MSRTNSALPHVYYRRMRPTIALMLLVACGEETRWIVDYDGPIPIDAYVVTDARLSSKCPPIGTMPRFAPKLRRAVNGPCSDFSSGSGYALASCNQVAVVGPDNGGPLHPADGLVIKQPRIFADGNRAIGLVGVPYMETPISEVYEDTTVRAYERIGSGWVEIGALPFTRRARGYGTSGIRISNVTHALPGRRVFVEAPMNLSDPMNYVQTWREWQELADGWAPVPDGSYNASELGLPPLAPARLGHRGTHPRREHDQRVSRPG
jgi:hypothetical protein